MTVALNKWWQCIFNILNNAPAIGLEAGGPLLIKAMLDFFKILGAAVAISYLLTNTVRVYAFWWRDAITFNYIPKWTCVTTDLEGVSQRIQEDTGNLANSIVAYGIQLIRALMTLVAFLPILWNFSRIVNIPWVEGKVLRIDHLHSSGSEIFINYIPGSLVWMVLIASLIGIGGSWLLGKKLPSLRYQNRAVEAAFRKELVHGEDNGRKRSFIKIVEKLFAEVRRNTFSLIFYSGIVESWRHVYSQAVFILPYYVLGLGLFTECVTLGIMMQIIDAFQKVHGNGIALLTDNWNGLTDLVSTLKRLHELEAKLCQQK